MDTYGKIKEKIKSIAGTPVVIHEGSVTSVSGSTCEVAVGGVVLSDVRLCSVAAEDDMLITPQVGSYVTVIDLSAGKLRDLAVIKFGKIDSVQLFGGTHPVCYADTLKTELGKMSNRIDTIINALKNSIPVAQDGGAAYKAEICNALQGLSSEDFSDIEDTKIKH